MPIEVLWQSLLLVLSSIQGVTSRCCNPAQVERYRSASRTHAPSASFVTGRSIESCGQEQYAVGRHSVLAPRGLSVRWRAWLWITARCRSRRFLRREDSLPCQRCRPRDVNGTCKVHTVVQQVWIVCRCKRGIYTCRSCRALEAGHFGLLAVRLRFDDQLTLSRHSNFRRLARRRCASGRGSSEASSASGVPRPDGPIPEGPNVCAVIVVDPCSAASWGRIQAIEASFTPEAHAQPTREPRNSSVANLRRTRP